MFLVGFPLLLVPFAIYNIVAFLMPGVSWTGTLATVTMKSGGDWTLTGGDVLVTLAVALLFVEMMKAARPGARSFVDHGLSLLLFVAMLAEFVLVKQAASGTFFLLVVASFFDVLGGFMLGLRARRREMLVEPVATAPQLPEPAPQQAVSPAEHPEPAAVALSEPPPAHTEHTPT